MALINPFIKKTQNSFLYNHNPVLKLVELGLTGFVVSTGDLLQVLVLTVFLFIVHVFCEKSLFITISSYIPFVPLIAVITFAAFVTSSYDIRYSIQLGLQYFVYTCLALLFYITTDQYILTVTIEKILKFVPFVSEKKVALFIRIVTALLPVLFNSLMEISAAVKSRGLDFSGSPLRWVRYLSTGLTVNSMIHSSQFSDALESRNFLSFSSRDKILFRFKDLIIFTLYAIFLLIIYNLSHELMLIL
jgi:energy-coupling factor transporter transmembrane protein EcfT